MLSATGETLLNPMKRDVSIEAYQPRKQENMSLVIDSMVKVMHGRRGTARSSGRKAAYKMAGKTGTAQVVGIKQGERYDADALAERHRDHALFVGFAPYETPKIALAIIVENGGGGSRAAAPVARKIFDAWVLDFPETESAKKTTSNATTILPAEFSSPVRLSSPAGLGLPVGRKHLATPLVPLEHVHHHG